jgi:hypothetical protein
VEDRLENHAHFLMGDLEEPGVKERRAEKMREKDSASSSPVINKWLR